MIEVNYSYGPYNKIKGDKQAIRITEGCPHGCQYCYEKQKYKIFDIPKIVKNNVLIYDMNLLCKPEARYIINQLGKKRVNDHVVYYDAVCGFDYRFTTQEIANEIKQSRFKNIRIAWDWGMNHQYKVKDAVKMFVNAGYRPNKIMIFMICNWKITAKEVKQKIDLCKVWNVKIGDCYFDNQLSPNIKPLYWSSDEIKEIRKTVRKHNQLVNFGIDPEIKTNGP